LPSSYPFLPLILSLSSSLHLAAVTATPSEPLNIAIPKTSEEQHRVFLMKKQLVDELVSEAIIDGERSIQVELRAKIMDLAVSKQILDFPNGVEIVVRL